MRLLDFIQYASWMERSSIMKKARIIFRSDILYSSDLNSAVCHSAHWVQTSRHRIYDLRLCKEAY